MEILADRELAFFPGTAVGPRYPGYRYQDNTGEHVVAVRAAQHAAQQVYFNGGCWFREDVAGSGWKVLWEYESDTSNTSSNTSSSTSAAVIGLIVGLGRVVLSGVHPEIGYSDVDNNQHSDQVNAPPQSYYYSPSQNCFLEIDHYHQ